MTLVDTNILLDLFTDDPVWADGSTQRLDRAALKGPIAINDVIYAELSVRFATIEALDAVLIETGIVVEALPRAALFLAAKVFHQYRAAGGARTGVPPDFFIGAQAAISAWPLLTRDARRYRRYLPTVALETPERPTWSPPPT